jgi:hypothetical protein
LSGLLVISKTWLLYFMKLNHRSHRFVPKLRLIAAGSLVVAAAALSLSSLFTQPTGQFGEHHRGSAAFLKHTEDVVAAKLGDLDERPTSLADQNYQLNGGDSITAEDIAGAQAAFNAIAASGAGKNKNSTTAWYSLGPTTARYPAFLNRHGNAYDASGRITALAIGSTCTAQNCTLWVGAAGGGVWKTDQALSGNGNWANVSDGYFASGAIGALTYDAAHNTLYAGTGEDAAAGDAEAGLGIYKSTDGGKTWAPLGGNASFFLRSIRQITVDNLNDPSGNTIYVASGRGVSGISSTTAGALSSQPGGAGVGVWKSTNGGASFTLLAPVPVALGAQAGQSFPSSFGSSRGATGVVVDPTHPGVIYATAYNVGVWRSNNNGATWTNIHAGNNTGADRSEIAVVTMPSTNSRIYQGEGDSGTPYSRFFVADTVETGAPVFVDKTSSNPADTGPVKSYATYNFCTGQCWYDEGVYSPPGYPNIVYVFGSFVYGESHGISNARAVLLSRDGGNTFTDLTDAASGTDANHDGLHPDQHALITNPNNPLQFFEGSDGGLMVSDGTLADASSRCDKRGLDPVSLNQCKSLLQAVPGRYIALNPGLNTLQFQSVSVNPANPKNIQGGTQDNGTFETTSSTSLWPQTIFGDGGLSGFDATDKKFRFHTYFDAQVDVNFNNGQDRAWDWIADSFFIPPGNSEARLFYFPIITDPAVHGTMFAGLTHVWRTKDNGGPQPYLDQHCNEFTGDFTVQCGDWEFLDGTTLTSAARGNRSGGAIGWISRTSGDTSTLWTATTTGRLFVSKNADLSPASAVVFNRIDSTAATSPNRPISSISIDPANPNRAFVSYLSYNARFVNAVPVTNPGHVFLVTYNPTTNTATWTNLEGTGTPIGDQPVNGVAYDPVSGDLYAATDFGVLKLAGANPANGWTLAASGMPVVTVPGLTINPAERQLLASTHGRGAYQLTLP